MSNARIKIPETEFPRDSGEKISAREQIFFDTRFAIAFLLNSFRVNIGGFDAKKDLGSPDFARELCRLEEKEMRASRKINELLENFGVNFSVEGAENIPPEPVIFLARHESWWDTVGLQDILKNFARREHPAKYLAKAELLEIPVLGTAMRRAGHISFDRKNGKNNSQKN